MVIESSALIAILLEEPGYQELEVKIATSVRRYMSACSLVEASVALRRRKDIDSVDQLNEMIERFGILIVPFNADQAKLGQEADIRFGRGMHSAKLNLGDCFSYALARYLNEPLLFKGNDFSQTDIELA